jgi:hypothetical protein
MKDISKLCGQNSEFCDVNPRGSCSDQRYLKDRERTGDKIKKKTQNKFVTMQE